jgi:hypothetical protein
VLLPLIPERGHCNTGPWKIDKVGDEAEKQAVVVGKTSDGPKSARALPALFR